MWVDTKILFNKKQFDCSAWHRMVRDILLTSLGLLTWFCALSASCASPAFLLAGQPKELISHWLSVNTAQLQVKHGRDITFFHPKSKTASYQLLWGKLTLSQSKPRHWYSASITETQNAIHSAFWCCLFLSRRWVFKLPDSLLVLLKFCFHTEEKENIFKCDNIFVNFDIWGCCGNLEEEIQWMCGLEWSK